jgi:hypothetical protein
MAVQILTRLAPRPPLASLLRPPRCAVLLRPALLLLGACISDHHVSPFPPIDLATALRPADDLPGQLARASREAQASGLRETLRIEGKLPGGHAFVALGFSGTDAAGLPTHATRVVTPASVVLALGPARVVLQEPPRPDELLPALHASGAFPSGVDLTGDRSPDVALRASDGVLAVYRIDLQGSAPYPIVLRARPTRVLDLDEDGRPDLAGAPPIPDGDPIRPEFLDIAVADGAAFRNDHPAVIAHHRALADAPPPPPTTPLPQRLRAAMERTFHGACAGDPLTLTLQPVADLVAANHPLPEPLAASWSRWRAWLGQTFPPS